MSEIVSEWFKNYKNIVYSYQKYYNNLIELYLNSMEFTIDNTQNAGDQQNIMYFNGYLKGYEAAMTDKKQLHSQYNDENRDPASIYF